MCNPDWWAPMQPSFSKLLSPIVQLQVVCSLHVCFAHVLGAPSFYAQIVLNELLNLGQFVHMDDCLSF